MFLIQWPMGRRNWAVSCALASGSCWLLSLMPDIQWHKAANCSLSCSALLVLSSSSDLQQRCIGAAEFFECALNNPQSSSHKGKETTSLLCLALKKGKEKPNNTSYHKALIVHIPCPPFPHTQTGRFMMFIFG